MAQEEVYELNWDDEIDDGEERERVVFEPGEYDFTVAKFERSKSKESGNNMAVVDLKVTDGERSTYVRDWIVLKSNMIWKIASYFRSVGLKKHGEKTRMLWKESIGTSGRCSLIVEESEYQGKTTRRNRIDRYLDPVKEVEDVDWI